MEWERAPEAGCQLATGMARGAAAEARSVRARRSGDQGAEARGGYAERVGAGTWREATFTVWEEHLEPVGQEMAAREAQRARACAELAAAHPAVVRHVRAGVHAGGKPDDDPDHRGTPLPVAAVDCRLAVESCGARRDLEDDASRDVQRLLLPLRRRRHGCDERQRSVLHLTDSRTSIVRSAISCAKPMASTKSSSHQGQPVRGRTPAEGATARLAAPRGPAARASPPTSAAGGGGQAGDDIERLEGYGLSDGAAADALHKGGGRFLGALRHLAGRPPQTRKAPDGTPDSKSGAGAAVAAPMQFAADRLFVQALTADDAVNPGVVETVWQVFGPTMFNLPADKDAIDRRRQAGMLSHRMIGRKNGNQIFVDGMTFSDLVLSASSSSASSASQSGSESASASGSKSASRDTVHNRLKRAKKALRRHKRAHGRKLPTKGGAGVDPRSSPQLTPIVRGSPRSGSPVPPLFDPASGDWSPSDRRPSATQTPGAASRRPAKLARLAAPAGPGGDGGMARVLAASLAAEQDRKARQRRVEVQNRRNMAEATRQSLTDKWNQGPAFAQRQQQQRQRQQPQQGKGLLKFFARKEKK